MPAFIVRPATSADIPALARLIVELYHAELPGLLSGSQRGQEQLLAYTLRANGEAALRHRLVVCDEQQQVVGTGMVQFPTEPVYERAPQERSQWRCVSLGWYRHSSWRWRLFVPFLEGIAIRTLTAR